MSLAAEARTAVRSVPFLYDGLRAGVVNYAAAARLLDVSEDTQAVATALRRFTEDLHPPEWHSRDVRVTMHGGLTRREPGGDDPVLAINGQGFIANDGPLTGILAVGDVDPAALIHTLGVLSTQNVEPEAAGVAGETLVVVVDGREAGRGLQAVEAALDNVPV